MNASQRERRSLQKKRFGPGFKRSIRKLLAGLAALCLVFWAPSWLPTRAVIAVSAIEADSVEASSTAGQTALQAIDQAKTLYDLGRFNEAIVLLLQASQDFAAQGDRLQQAVALSNLSLTYQRIGEWTEAATAIQQSLTLILDQPPTLEVWGVQAQALSIQGHLQFAKGQTEAAIDTWKQAATAYRQASDASGETQSRINQAQALQAMGLYRRAIATLVEIGQTLQDQPDSTTKAIALRSLGDALGEAGSLDQAQIVLQRSLVMAEQLQQPEAIAAAMLSLGNVTRAAARAELAQNNLTLEEAVALREVQARLPLVQRRQQEAAQKFLQQAESAIALYQDAATLASAPSTQLQAQLNLLQLQIETQRWAEAAQLSSQVQRLLDQLPASRNTIYDRIDLAQSLTALSDRSLPTSFEQAARLLAIANQQAVILDDARAQSYALGSLGRLYEKTQQWDQARSLTEQALLLSQSAPDISYRWQWQLGRLLKQQGDRDQAIAAYGEAVTTLQTLRKDLVTVNRDVQFSFRESVEPVYREMVDLLLKDEKISQIDGERLVQARDVIEGLQIAELDNFFREACLDTAFQLDRVIDQANLSAAIIYTIVLPDRLEVILKLPQQPLRFHTAQVTQATLEATTDTLLAELKQPFTSETLQRSAQKLYDWLIRPEAAALAESTQTLVFVLDGALRSIPMSVLHDGQNYLVENYSVAIAPGLQLPDPKPLEARRLKALVAGLSEAREDFPALNFVETEVEQIRSDIPSQVLLNQSFTRDNFQKLLDSTDFSIVHIATHGQFSSNAKDTFILAWDDPINVTELGSLLQARDITNPNPIELLVLSACRTAVGDRRATLGLAGVAVKAGARSTIASLWSLDDDSGAALMKEFYKQLSQGKNSKAEALRQAQRMLISDPNYKDPRFWSPYVLLGNWL